MRKIRNKTSFHQEGIQSVTKECSVKVSEIRGKQRKLNITELTENERTEITTEKKDWTIHYFLCFTHRGNKMR